MARTTMAELREEIELLKEGESTLRREKVGLIDHQHNLDREIQKLKAVAQHYRTQRDRIDAYLSGVLDEGADWDSRPPATDEPDRLTNFEPGPIQLVRNDPAPRPNPLRPQLTEPGQKDHAGYDSTERIDWEAF